MRTLLVAPVAKAQGAYHSNMSRIHPETPRSAPSDRPGNPHVQLRQEPDEQEDEEEDDHKEEEDNDDGDTDDGYSE